LKYVDEEGDLVNLVDDADFHDMISQKLEFLRIKVHMVDTFGGETPWIEAILVFCAIVIWGFWVWVMCLNILNQSTKG
jgi:hypothetical protein